MKPIFEQLESRTLYSVISTVDLQAVANNWQDSVPAWSAGDFNGDGVVDIRDLQFVANNWQEPAPAPTIPGAVNPGNPTDASYVDYSPSPLLGPTGKATASDFAVQGPPDDCYFFAVAAANPTKAAALVKQVAFGWYEVTIKGVNILEDAELPTWFIPPPDGSIIGGIEEKAFAYYRYKENTYASLDYGTIGEAASIFGDAFTAASSQSSTIWNTITASINAGHGVIAQTPTANTPLVLNHYYNVTAYSTDASGTQWLTLTNPWGIDDATVTLAQFQQWTTLTYVGFE